MSRNDAQLDALGVMNEYRDPEGVVNEFAKMRRSTLRALIIFFAVIFVLGLPLLFGGKFYVAFEVMVIPTLALLVLIPAFIKNKRDAANVEK